MRLKVRKPISIILVLMLALSLFAAMPFTASAAEDNLWTGRWSERDPKTGNPGEDFSFWQTGDKVVGIYGSYGDYRFVSAL